MSFFADLTPYTYRPLGHRPGTINVGWLCRWQAFSKWRPDAIFLRRLWPFCSIGVWQTRGFHHCPFCLLSIPLLGRPVTEYFMGEAIRLGSAEVRVFAPDGRTYAAPDLVFHYIRRHHYLPPREFIDAVMNGAPPSTPQYVTTLSHHISPEPLPARLQTTVGHHG